MPSICTLKQHTSNFSMEELLSRRHFLFHFLFLMLLHLQSCRQLVVEAQNVTTVRVGAVLSLSTSVGRKSHTSISMALEDFYAAHPRYSTRIGFDFVDSMVDSVAAASAAVDLLNNQVEAIIGPMTSSQTKFAAYLSNRAHVPLISYSATSPTISSAHLPYFIRATLNDSSLSVVIASFIQHFGWRAIIPVYEDSDFGSGILPSLIDALQPIDTRIPDRAVIPTTANEEYIEKELNRLMNLQTRVFLVHMLPNLATTLFKLANKLGMMSSGYVWMVTDSVTTVLGTLNATDIDSMRGVIGFQPYVPKSDKISNFSTRFKARFQKDYPGTNMTEPTIFQFRAYDAAWLLAKAVEMANVTTPSFTMPRMPNGLNTAFDRLGVSQAGPQLLDAIHNTTFDGLAGNFSLVDGQLQLSAYEIVNIIESGPSKVGYWTLSEGLTSELSNLLGGSNTNSSDKLKPILWPGDQDQVPRGWLIPTEGKKLNIAVPVKHGFVEFVNVSEPISNKYNITGYCIDVFDTVMKKLPYHVEYQYIPYPKSSISYNNFLYQIYLQKFDVVVGDTTILANRTSYVDFTLPYTESGVSMVVPIKQDTSKTMWIFLQPLTARLWLTSLASFFFTGFCVWVIEHRINSEFRGTIWQQIGLIFYFSFSTLVFAHKEKLESNLSRFLVIIWIFFVLILTSSYTASLTSMLTVRQLEPTITDVNELLRRGDYIGYQDGSFVVALLKRLNFETSKMRNYSTVDQYAEALAKGSADGGVAAIFDEIPYLKVFLSKYCDNHTMVGPTYKTDGFGFAFPRGSPLVADVSRAILNVTEGDGMTKIENTWFHDLSACSSRSSNPQSSSLRFRSFAGLFIITGVVSVLMFIIYIVRYIYTDWVNIKGEWNAERNVASRVRAISRRFDRMDSSVRPAHQEQNGTDSRHGAAVAPGPESVRARISHESSSPMTSPSTQAGSPVLAEGQNLASQVSDGQAIELEPMTEGR